nr:BLUF domain-containing protein [Paracoccus saliphilus]
MAFTRLVYVSRHWGIPDEALDEILLVSRANNERDGITGLLISSDEDFMQLLEGDRTVVAECMMRIMKDDRHERIQILLATDAEVRLFSRWSMRCIKAAEIEQKIQARYWINKTFDPARMTQAAIEDLCLALSKAP